LSYLVKIRFQSVPVPLVADVASWFACLSIRAHSSQRMNRAPTQAQAQPQPRTRQGLGHAVHHVKQLTMSSRSSSPTPSDSSSGSQPGQGGEDSALRLAQLEALLNASLGYDPPDHSAQPDDEPPNKKRKHLTQPDDAQDVVVEKPVVAETGPTEIG